MHEAQNKLVMYAPLSISSIEYNIAFTTVNDETGSHLTKLHFILYYMINNSCDAVLVIHISGKIQVADPG